MANSRFDTRWRRIAAAAFDPPNDSKIYTTLDVDVTAVESVMASLPEGRAKLVHFVIAATARTVAEDAPEVNCYLRRGRAVPRDSVDMTISASLPDSPDLVDLTLRNVDAMSVEEIADEVRRALRANESAEKQREADRRYALARMPWPFRRWAFRVLRFVTHRMGISLPGFDLAPDTFGSVFISDVSRTSLRMRSVVGPLFPAAFAGCLLIICPVQERVVFDDGTVSTRREAPLSATFDHRLIDGNTLLRLFDGITRRLNDPAKLCRSTLVPESELVE